MLKQTILNLFDTGYCKNFEKMVSKKSPFRIKKFYALAGLIEHPELGPILFDTGYSEHLIKLIKKFPFQIYSFINPIYFEKNLSACNQIQKYGYKKEDIKHIIISHFHPDHIAGLKDFPNATFYGSTQSYQTLKKLSKIQSLKALYFSDLFPADFEERFKPFDRTPCKTPFAPFVDGYDLFKDQSIIAINLPGHADGQIGVFIKTESQIVFLCADACWQTSNYIYLQKPHLFAKIATSNYSKFCDTLEKLHFLKKNHPYIEIIPTHCQTMWNRYVEGDKPC